MFLTDKKISVALNEIVKIKRKGFLGMMGRKKGFLLNPFGRNQYVVEITLKSESGYGSKIAFLSMPYGLFQIPLSQTEPFVTFLKVLKGKGIDIERNF
ncbi:MAG TPA: hypothetical protein VNW99_10410 [Cytophagaceae bacterium]|nr:hypothetical protein [Cytophagaceae bacterium]